MLSYLTHPYASPLFGDLTNLPPMLIQSGDSEVLRDEVTLLAHKATLSGVHVTHELYEDMIHVFQMYSFLPAAEAAIASIGRWVRVTLPGVGVGVERDEKAMAGGGGVEVGGRVSLEGEMLEGVRRDGKSEDDVGMSGKDGLELILNEEEGGGEQPSIDIDSLPAGSSRSGSPTPVASPSLSHRNSFTVPAPSAPRLRRALTEYTTTSSTSTIPTPSGSPTITRRRRRTQGAASLSTLPSPLPSSAQSNPVSPTPSIRMRLRSPTMSSISSNHSHSMSAGPVYASLPSTRMRSESHSDMVNLVEGYVEGGAANETTVFSPGGEIRSVGVLGLEDDEESEEIGYQ
jgi:hypothetical protein